MDFTGANCTSGLGGLCDSDTVCDTVTLCVCVCSHAHVLTKQLADASFADGAAVIMDTAKYIRSYLLTYCCH